MGCSPCGGNGHGQDCIGAQLGLILRTVCLYHGLVYAIYIGCVHTLDRIMDDGIDVLYCPAYTLASETVLIAIS